MDTICTIYTALQPDMYFSLNKVLIFIRYVTLMKLELAVIVYREIRSLFSLCICESPLESFFFSGYFSLIGFCLCLLPKCVCLGISVLKHIRSTQIPIEISIEYIQGATKTIPHSCFDRVMWFTTPATLYICNMHTQSNCNNFMFSPGTKSSNRHANDHALTVLIFTYSNTLLQLSCALLMYLQIMSEFFCAMLIFFAAIDCILLQSHHAAGTDLCLVDTLPNEAILTASQQEFTIYSSIA